MVGPHSLATLHPAPPNPQNAVLVWNVGDGPVVGERETSYGVAEVVVSTPLRLDALWSRETRVWWEFGPHGLLPRSTFRLVERLLTILLRDGDDWSVSADVFSEHLLWKDTRKARSDVGTLPLVQVAA